jgi:hypothetical protein
LKRFRQRERLGAPFKPPFPALSMLGYDNVEAKAKEEAGRLPKSDEDLCLSANWALPLSRFLG